ncbi:MAG: hypothetical protein Q7J68_02975 [Thermoplasmata archaeon]|nr:hypothetical protein [Thermoplasmata archaeon]
MEPKDFDKYMEKLAKLQLNNSFDIPYFAGYNREGSVIYIDDDVPKTVAIGGKELNLHMSLALHELVEKIHIDQGYTYPGAHEIATKYEKHYVENQGIAWDDYDREVGKLMHTNWISKWKSVPKDLDMTPYQYSHDVKTLSKIRKYLME